jgi:hypothetical protein
VILSAICFLQCDAPPRSSLVWNIIYNSILDKDIPIRYAEKHNGAVHGRSVSDGALPDHSVWDAGGSPLVGHSPNDPHEGL